MLVHHDYANLGLGRRLMTCVLRAAGEHGIPKVYGVVLAENTAMLDLAKRLGFTLHADPDMPGCVRAELATDCRRCASRTLASV